jgi:hypothetical protein
VVAKAEAPKVEIDIVGGGIYTVADALQRAGERAS